MTTKFAEGEYIALVDTGIYPLNEYAKGWIDGPAFAAAYLKETGVAIAPPTDLRYRYARWLQTATSKDEGWGAEFRTYDTPGRGCFKITEVPYRSIEWLPNDARSSVN